MTINMSHRVNPEVPWVVVLWLVLIASGASTTGLLRAPLATTGVVPVVLSGHVAIGAVTGVFALVHLVRARRRRQVWRMALVAAAVACGWFASRSFAPVTVSGHAALSAFATLALAGGTTDAAHLHAGAFATAAGWTWKAVVVRIGLGLVLLQIALGALLRHHLIGLTWHLLAGGLTALAILVPAVAIVQDPSAPIEPRRAARWAIASLLAQVSLGVAVFFMILVGTATVELWLATTIAHVTVGSLTLLAAAWLVRALATPAAAAADTPARASP